MITEVLLIHHSHTDIGYTHPQPVIFELHRRFIDQALMLADATRDWPDECRFKWTCEVTGITLDWWQRARDHERRRLLDAIGRGQVEVAGLPWNLTPLVDHGMLLRLMQPVQHLRAEGIPVHSAMNSDVNGLPWGVVDALLDFGIDGLSMGINEHYGCAVQPRPRAFWWESPSGRKLLVWNGLQYWNAANVQMRITEGIQQVEEAMPAFLRLWEERGYPYSYFPVQITTRSAPDNASPEPRLPSFVREWNAREPAVRMRMATLSEMLERLRAEDLHTLRGDWTDWWNFGAGSTARETAVALNGERLLSVASQLEAWRQRASASGGGDTWREAERALGLFVEHTWGADRSVRAPESMETHSQLTQKLAFAYSGFGLARYLQREALVSLARTAGGDDLTALFYNPLPFPVRRTLTVPPHAGEVSYLAEDASNLAHRQDVMLADMPSPAPGGEAALRVGPLDMPALGYVAIPYDRLPQPSNERLEADGRRISNGSLEVRFDPERGGIESMWMDGENAALDATWRFAEPVLERPASGQRGALFGPLNWRDPDVYLQWHAGWDAIYERAAAAPQCSHAVIQGCAIYQQRLEMPNGDRLVLDYALHAGEPGLELKIDVQKAGSAAPHGLYLAFPVNLDRASARCHFVTAGAVVELDREQLPNASRHYITTLDWIRVQDGRRGVTIACPDAPLWQAGGFTFGRHREGAVERRLPMLAAWLTNNYWDTNFCANQAGRIHFRFRLLPHAAQEIGASIHQALPYVFEPQFHAYRELGPMRQPVAGLLRVDLGAALLTSVQPAGGEVLITMLNPENSPQTVRIGQGALRFATAGAATLSGARLGDLPVVNGEVELELPARAWQAVLLEIRASSDGAQS